MSTPTIDDTITTVATNDTGATDDTGLPQNPSPAHELGFDSDIFEVRESAVRSYSRSWPTVFTRASGSWLTASDGRRYLDFFAGAGALNYGHNHPALKSALIDYIADDNITHGLDMFTVAKGRFLQQFTDTILTPRGLDYKVMFPGPTGTNAVEAALKLARKVTGREAIINFTNAFHGMTLGSLSVTGNSMKRAGAGVPLVHTTPMPFDNYFDGSVEDFSWFERVLDDAGSGFNRPAAVIVETVQGEGGVNVARAEWLRALANLCREREILLIVDDVQMGCGRTGTFFSFEAAGIVPDIVTISKSIGGYGLPMALTLFRPDLDVWEPGEHNGTFRGNNPAFVTATKALETFWGDDTFAADVRRKGLRMHAALEALCRDHGSISSRGRGMVAGLAFGDPAHAAQVCERAFARGLLVESAGPSDEVVKLLPALTISDEDLDDGLRLLAEVTEQTLRDAA
ncbi:diaminobutyrate--2-oxoglutarate transaminase [Gordonia jinhuaensis]|uniref:Diaminobutyrate--2-oxoglutarate transaminase n=1 Tax=Gordonia jinhuaensis TaxID=1517702 RepID=A0A916WU02_9ACTN|nr:diaminobutyrate--2-oxoglutarate transaminase [Gordonia jinhuaensis]GGB30478.1 putative diaminobutyrate--2-oxoglutarate aminotransferase [Gordonia jinhuaensis]